MSELPIASGDYAMLRDAIIAALEPPDDDAAEEAILIAAVERCKAERDALAAQLRTAQLAYVQLESAYLGADRVGRFGYYWQQVAAALYPSQEQSRRTDALDTLIAAAERLADVSAQGDGSDEFDSVVAAYAGTVVEAVAAYRKLVGREESDA